MAVPQDAWDINSSELLPSPALGVSATKLSYKTIDLRVSVYV